MIKIERQERRLDRERRRKKNGTGESGGEGRIASPTTASNERATTRRGERFEAAALLASFPFFFLPPFLFSPFPFFFLFFIVTITDRHVQLIYKRDFKSA